MYKKYLGSSQINYFFSVTNEAKSFSMFVSESKQVNKSKENYNAQATKFCKLRYQLHKQNKFSISISTMLIPTKNKLIISETNLSNDYVFTK